MELILIFFVWFLNLGISAWNAYVVGKSWPYTKQIGGWTHLVTWSGYVMSVCGFSWCFLIPFALLCYVNQWAGFDSQALIACMNLGYIILAPMICLSGVFIWVDSLIQAWKQKTFTSFAVAGWNTFAQVYNTYEVFTTIGPAFNNVSSFFSSSGSKSNGNDNDSDSKDNLILLVIIIVILAILLGFVVATAIVIKTAQGELRSFKDEAIIKIGNKK